MNSPNPDIRLQDLLDHHASGTAAEALLAEARSLPDGQALAVDLALALALGRELPARLPAARRAAMQVALQEAFQAQQAAAPRRPAFAFLPGRLAFRLGAAVLACVLALGGGMVASAKSLPGDALYSLKRVTESARLAFSWSPESRARVWMELSDLRHQEIQDLDAAGRPMPDSLMTAWLDAHHQARQAAQASGDPALLQTVAEQAERHARDLEQLPQPGAGDAAEQLRDAAAQMPQAGEDPSMPAQATLDPTPSPLPATATAVGAAGGAAGQDEPGPPVAATATSRPLSPRDAWRTGTPPSQATRDAWATERASRPTDAPGHGGRGGRGGRGDDPRRATEEARWATERARRGQEATPAPGQPTAEPRPTRPPLPPGIGPTQGPPPGPPMPTRRPSRTPDPQRTPGGGPGRPGPGEPGTPNPTWPPRRGTPPAPPTVAPDPSEQPLPTTLSGEVPTPVATPTPEARSLP